MDLNLAIQRIERALVRASGCTAGLLGQKHVFGVLKGPSGGPEILASLCLDYDLLGFWYGHILKHPQNKDKYVSTVIRTKNFINASDIERLFNLFHYRTRECLDSQVCAAQDHNDIFYEADSFESGVSALINMIKNFDVEKVSASDDSKFEFRTLVLCGFKFDFLKQDDVHDLDHSSKIEESKATKGPR